MAKSQDIFYHWIRRGAVQFFSILLVIWVIIGYAITRKTIFSIELKFLWDVFPELTGVFAALIYSYYWGGHSSIFRNTRKVEAALSKYSN